MEALARPIAALPSPAHCARQPASVRARLWIRGCVFGPQDDAPRLWLHLRDGRVLAFRLPEATLGDDSLIAPLARRVADDLSGQCWAVEHPAWGHAHVLYAAPVLPAIQARHAGFVFDPAFQAFAAGLDAEVIRLLLALERQPTPAAITRRDRQPPLSGSPPFYASVRNYNRLATLEPRQRERRLQALARFPPLVAPLLLTAHHAPNAWDGKRHGRREKNVALEALIDQGKNLVGALADHYGISKGLVRAPLNAVMWYAPDHATRLEYLRLLDALPAQDRPEVAEFERWQPYLLNYFTLLDGGPRDRGPSSPPVVHRGAFRLGWTRTWEKAARHHGDLHVALADCRDFLAGARERAADLLRRRHGPELGRLAGAWLACHGLVGLLAASQRWHRQRPPPVPTNVPANFRLPALLGEFTDAGCRAEELLTPAALAAEGEAMKHCVARYWPQIVAGERIFALRLADGTRATAQYARKAGGHASRQMQYRLVQLRGPCNQEVGEAMHAWARTIQARLDAAQRLTEWPRALEQARRDLAMARLKTQRVHVGLDERSERQLRAALAWLSLEPPAPDVLFSTHVAGFQYHAGPHLEARLSAGLRLDLIREPDNAHDPLAVRAEWQGHQLGYVPRPENAGIAERLDAGEKLAARIVGLHVEREPLWRVEVAIDIVRD